MDGAAEVAFLAVQIGLQVLGALPRLILEAERIFHRVDGAVLGRGDREPALGVAEGDPALLRRDEQLSGVFVAGEPAKDLLVGVVERAVRPFESRVGASVEAELRLVGAVHGRGAPAAEGKKDCRRRNAHEPYRRHAARTGGAGHTIAPAASRQHRISMIGADPSRFLKANARQTLAFNLPRPASRAQGKNWYKRIPLPSDEVAMPAKALLVTGASRGIGRASALLAAKHGWSIGVNYRDDAKAAAAVVETIAKGGGRAVALRGDVSIEADVVAMFEKATQALGPLTGVVANAGVVAPTARLVDMSVERMRRIFEVNVLGACLTAREAARRMAKSAGGAGGAIVMMSSAAARLGSPNLYVDYAASKGAIDTLTLGLAKELGPEGVRVNAIRPGLIDTELHASGGDPDRAHVLGRSAPLARPGTAEEIAEAAVWLLSDAASYVTGAILDVAGGR